MPRDWLAGIVGVIWYLGIVLLCALYDLMRWHPRQTLVIIVAFLGTLVGGVWLSLE